MRAQYRPPLFSAALFVITLVSFARAQGRAIPNSPLHEDRVPEGLIASDWSSIRAAYETGRHAVASCEDGYRARNPSQQWETHFDGRGFTTTPDAGGWKWGLELKSFGFPGEERQIEGCAPVNVDSERVAYAWDSTMEEWYENEERGLEHGYTLHQRPIQHGDVEGPLSFTLAVRGELRPQVQADGRGVWFLNESDAAVVTYAGLHVFDAEGNDLPARLEKAAAGLRLIVQEDGAPYPLTIDPIAQQAYLKASNTDASDRFGDSISISGDTVVVGAPLEASNATGVNGDQNNDSLPEAGAAYVFVRNGTTWSQQAYLKASNPDANDRFGVSVSVSGDTAVVGAYWEDSNATGVNGDQSNNGAMASGAAYVFVRNGTSWSQQAYLKASNTGAVDYFGVWVSVSADTVVVGAQQEDSSATGVNGNQSSNSAQNSGAVYVFVRNGTTWSQQAYLKASNTEADDEFGAVEISNNTVIVGASGEDSNATGVNGNQGDNSAVASGAAYVFVRSGTTWSQQAYLKASNTASNDVFGVATSISADTVIVGAGGEDSNATGVDGDQNNNSASASGAAYVFVRNGTTWSQQAYLKASNTASIDGFGGPISISADTVVVGAQLEDSNATGVNGDQNNNSASASGAAYVFVRNGTTWSQQAYLKASNTDADDRFGDSISISGNTVVVSAPGEDSSATGVNGDQSDDSASASGAAYVFTITTSTDLSFCFGDGTGAACPCANTGNPGRGCDNSISTGGALLAASGQALLSADTLLLTSSHERPTAFSLFWQGGSEVAAHAFGDGVGCMGPPLKRMYRYNAVGGTVAAPQGADLSVSARSAALGDPITPGTIRVYHVFYRDPDPSFCPSPVGSTFNTTNGLRILWGG